MNDNVRGSFDPNEVSDWLWELIDDANGSREALQSRLHRLTRDEVIRFQNEFLDAAAQLADEPFLDYLDDDTSEDTLQDVAEWVVSQGKQFYVDVWNHPQRMADVDIRERVTYSGVADNVFWERFGMAVPDIRD